MMKSLFYFSVMKTGIAPLIFFITAISLNQAVAQEQRVQYPAPLKNSYYSVNIGYIHYPFSSEQLEPGFTVNSVTVPHTAVRLILYGREINKYLSARITYMRPVNWVRYNGINGDNSHPPVIMNIAGLTLEGRLPLHKKWSLSAEAGLGLITRSGFSKNDIAVVKHAQFSTVLTAAALQYHINHKWDLQLSASWSPAHGRDKQPYTVFYGAGFNYTMRELPKETIEKKIKSGYHFPKHSVSAAFTSHAAGYGVNRAVSGKIPIFWGGDVRIRQGFSLNYQRNIFHARKVFALDIGAWTAYWQSNRNRENFFTLSLYPNLIFNAVRTKHADIFLEYSVAGPTFISRKNIDNYDTGKKFTFLDFMGAGVVGGKNRSWIAGLRIAHYSNGNIYPENPGLMIPLTLHAGIVLK
jgi:hypothetical protein